MHWGIFDDESAEYTEAEALYSGFATYKEAREFVESLEEDIVGELEIAPIEEEDSPYYEESDA